MGYCLDVKSDSITEFSSVSAVSVSMDNMFPRQSFLSNPRSFPFPFLFSKETGVDQQLLFTLASSR